MSQPNATVNNDGRAAAALALTRLVGQMPEPGPITVNPDGLDGDQQRLAMAITRSGLRRYLTLQYLLDRLLDQRLSKLEPRLAGVLLSGAVQLLFFDGAAAYAVVDESVRLAKRMVRPKAGDMVNAVLRKLTRLIRERDANMPWSYASDRLPALPGCVVFNDPILPDPEDLPAYLSVTTSHPRALVNDWLKQFGPDRTRGICLHGLSNPTVYVCDPNVGYEPWAGTQEQLTAYLDANRLYRVQDPTAAKPVQALAEYYEHSEAGGGPTDILDLCAGRGTKTRQLAAAFAHSRITATDTHDDRRADLDRLAGQLDQVQMLSPEAGTGRDYDLILVDVPCTNTGVLGRRPEARYRYSHKTLTALAALQRRIVEQAARLIRPGGVICYSTCSLQRDENDPQAQALARLTGGRIIEENLTLPAPMVQPYHDGGYYALVQSGV